jgi:predicted MFS family arabinose efflux permease
MASRFGPLFRLRDFRYLVSSCALDALGSRITHMLLITLIALGNPGQMLAYSQGSLVFSLPPIIFSPFVGVLVDRWDRRRTLFASHLTEAALLVLAPVLFLLTRNLTPAWIILFLFFTADVFKNSTAPALLPGIVTQDQILPANSIWFTAARAASVIGMVGGGYLVRWVGWQVSFELDAAIRLAAALLILGIAARPAFRPASAAAGPVEAGPHMPTLGSALAQAGHRFVRQIWEVIVLVGQNRHVAFVMFSIFISFCITGIAYTILLFLIQQVLKLGAPGVGIYTGILAVGMLVGAVLIGLVGSRFSQPRIIVAGCGAIGALFLIGPWLINVWFIGIVALVAGLAFSWIGIAQTSILQTRVAPDIQGRIFATREFFSNVAFLATTLVIGVVSLMTVLKTLLIVVGAGLLVFAGLGYWIVSGLDGAKTGQPDINHR